MFQSFATTLIFPPFAGKVFTNHAYLPVIKDHLPFETKWSSYRGSIDVLSVVWLHFLKSCLFYLSQETAPHLRPSGLYREVPLYWHPTCSLVTASVCAITELTQWSNVCFTSHKRPPLIWDQVDFIERFHHIDIIPVVWSQPLCVPSQSSHNEEMFVLPLTRDRLSFETKWTL